MIPEDEDVPVGREVGGAVLDEGGQVVRVRHVGGAEVVHQAAQAPGLDLIDLVHGAGDDVVLPGPAAAGLHDHVHLIGDGGLDHFAQVAGAHAVLGFQVRAAHVDHDGDGVLAVADGRDPLGPGLPHHGGGGDHRGRGDDGGFRHNGRLGDGGRQGVGRGIGDQGILALIRQQGPYVHAGAAALAREQAEHDQHGDDDEQEPAILLGQHQEQGQQAQLPGGGPLSPVPILTGALIEAPRAPAARAHGPGGYLIPLAHVDGTGTDFFAVALRPFVFHGYALLLL